MRLNRRSLLLQGAAAALSMTAAGPAMAVGPSRLATLKPIITPELRMINANTGDRMSTTFAREGRMDEAQVRRVDWFMRDWREQMILPMDPELLWGLAAISEAAQRDGHSGEIRFLSGFRSKKTNDMLRRQGYAASRNSKHLTAEAVDFSLPGIPVEDIYAYAKWLQIGGVGHYPGRFVHMDTGRRRTWIG